MVVSTKFRVAFLGLVNALILLVCAAAMPAQTVFFLPYTTGWETLDSPGWTLAPLAAQNGWISNSNPAEGNRVVGTTILDGVTIHPKTGSQMHQSRTSYRGNYLRTTSPALASVTYATLDSLSINPVFVAEADFYLPGSQANRDGWHGLYVFDASPTHNVIAGVLLNNSTQKLELIGDGVTLAPAVLPRNQWLHLQLQIDFVNQAAYAYLNGSLIAGETAYNTSLDATADGSGNIAYAGLCNRAPASDANGVPYNPNAVSASTPHAAPPSVAFSDNFSLSALPAPDATPPALFADLSFDGISDLTVSPFFLPPNLPGARIVGDLVPPLVFTIRSTDGTSGTIIKTEPMLRAMGADGYAFLYGIPNGTYDIGIKPANGLQSVLKAVALSDAFGDVQLPAVILRGGDADGNNSVDFDDFLTLLNAFGSRASVPGDIYDPTADFNDDGIDNFDDFLILLGNWGAHGDTF